MEPLILISTIMNICWYVLSIIYVLYKYTSVFNHIYNFFKMCGRCINGIFYIKDYIRFSRDRVHIRHTSEEENDQEDDPLLHSREFNSPPSLFSRIKLKVKNFFSRNRAGYVELPVYETSYERPSHFKNSQLIRDENNAFNNHVDNLMNESHVPNQMKHRFQETQDNHNMIDLDHASDETFIRYIQNLQDPMCQTESVYYSPHTTHTHTTHTHTTHTAPLITITPPQSNETHPLTLYDENRSSLFDNVNIYKDIFNSNIDIHSTIHNNNNTDNNDSNMNTLHIDPQDSYYTSCQTTADESSKFSNESSYNSYTDNIDNVENTSNQFSHTVNSDMLFNSHYIQSKMK